MKVLLIQPDDATARAFEREARSLARVSNHPNIVALYRSGVTDAGYPYMVMEYAPGGSYAGLLRRRGRLPWQEAVATCRVVCDALGVAHAAGLLHRDVKPANLLVSEFGEPLLADFGIAAVAGRTATRSQLLATPAHASPEQIAGEPADARSDLYSLSSTLYHLIAGRPAFLHAADESIYPLLNRIAVAEPPPLPDDVPAELDEVIRAGMAKDPADRPASAAELHAALGVAVAGETLDAVAGLEGARATAVADLDPAPTIAAATMAAPTREDAGPPPAPVTVSAAPTGRAWWRRPRAAVFAAAAIGAVVLVSSGDGRPSTSGDEPPVAVASEASPGEPIAVADSVAVNDDDVAVDDRGSTPESTADEPSAGVESPGPATTSPAGTSTPGSTSAPTASGAGPDAPPSVTSTTTAAPGPTTSRPTVPIVVPTPTPTPGPTSAPTTSNPPAAPAPIAPIEPSDQVETPVAETTTTVAPAPSTTTTTTTPPGTASTVEVAVGAGAPFVAVTATASRDFLAVRADGTVELHALGSPSTISTGSLGTGGTAQLGDVVFDPRTNTIGAAWGNGYHVLWESLGAPADGYFGHETALRSLAPAHTGGFASADTTGDVHVLPEGEQDPKWILTGHSGPVRSMVSLDSGTFVTAADDDTVRICERSGARIPTPWSPP